MKKFLIFIAGLLCTIAIFILAALFGNAYVTHETYVNLNSTDISVAYSVNAFGRVIDWSSADKNGDNVLYYFDLNNKNITEAIEETVDELISKKFISIDNNSYIDITVTNSDKNKADSLTKKLQESMQNYLVGKSEIKNLNIEVKTADNSSVIEKSIGN